MWWMMRRKSGPRNERGAVAVIVAILFPVVILGLGAIVLDVGSGYAQRAQLQNGADAGALAVARSCAAGACDATAATTFAASNTNNSLDTTSEVTSGFPCGYTPSGVTPGLPPCPAGSENGAICPEAPDANYVDVLDNPLQSDGSKLVPDFFGKALRGPTYNGQAVGACAQSAWGPAQFSGGGVALTISYCEWSYYTNNGDVTKYPAPPAWPGTNPWPTTPEEVLQFKGSSTSVGNTCPTGSSGGTPISGGFASTDPTENKGCITATGSDGWYGSDPGNGIKNCAATLHADWLNQTVVLIPVFDNTEGTGNSGFGYHLSTLAAFVVTAWYEQDNNDGNCSNVPGSKYAAVAGKCSPQVRMNFCGGNSCLIGYFVQATDDSGDPGKGAGTGVIVPPKLTG